MTKHYKLLIMTFAMLLLGTGAAFAQSNLGVMDGRLSQLENEIRNLTGKIEEQSYKIKQLEDELDRRVSDAEIRLGDLEKRPQSSSNSYAGTNDTTVAISSANDNTTSTGTNQPAVSPWKAPNDNSTLGTFGGQGDRETLQYEEAFATLRNGNYDLAEQQFQTFLDQHSNHDLSNNARYWLAETYYVRNQYDRAAKGFATAYQNDPQGAKAPDNLLKLGLSLAGLGKNEDACIALGQLLNDFENGPRSIVGRAERETARLGCS